MLSKRLSLKTLLQAMVLSLVTTTVVLVTLVTLRASFAHAEQQVYERFVSAAAVVSATIDAKAEFLLFATDTLVKDFNTKRITSQAISDPSSENGASMASVMANHQARANAEFAILLDSEREFVWANAEVEAKAAQQAMQNEIGILAFNEQLYLLATSPMRFVEQSSQADAYIAMAINLQNVLDNQTIDQLGADFALLYQGNVLASMGPLQALAGALPMQDTQAGTLLERSWQGVRYLLWREQIRRFDQPVELLLLKPYSQAHISFLSFLTDLLIIIAVLLVLLLLAVRFVASAISRPLTRLVSYAGIIQQGKYEQIDVQPNSQELHALEQAFTSMQASIQAREQEVDRLAFFNELTQLPNRAGFKRQVIDLIHHQAGLVMVGLINLDRFGEVNDTIGHDQGDRLIKLVGERLQSGLPESGTLAHLSGDEFAVLFKDGQTLPIESMIEQLTAAFKMPFSLAGITLDVSASMGVALYPEHGKQYGSLMQNADIALNRCKQTHLDYCIFQAGEHEFSLQRLSLMSQLKQAIEQDQLRLYIQPKLNLRTGRVDSAECLVRWIHPELGFVAPDKFIGLAEQTGFIRQLTAWMIEQALRCCQKLGDERICLAVNISAVDLVDTALAGVIMNLLSTYQLPESCLALEVTESAVMGDAHKAIAALNLLDKMGLRLSIDDFGTGYSSMSQLKVMPVKELKIDKSFIDGVINHEQDAAIVATIVQLANNMKLDVVAEGVETQAVLTYLRQLGVQYAQGYYISKPMAADEFPAWLAAFHQDR